MTDVQVVILRIQSLAEERGISINQLLRESKLSKSVIDNMKRGSMPSADKLATIADYFGCSVDYILGRVDTPAMETSGASSMNQKNQTENALTPAEVFQIREILHGKA